MNRRHSKAHGPRPRMIKGPHMCQPKFDTWAKTEEGRHQDHAESELKLRIRGPRKEG